MDDKTQEGIAYFKLGETDPPEIFGLVKKNKINEHEVELYITHREGTGL